MRKIQSVAVIGSGTMGQGIAQVFSLNGYPTQLFDIHPEKVNNAISVIQKSVQILIDKGKLESSMSSVLHQNLTPIFNFEQVKADFIIEAIVENKEAKKDIFIRLADINNEHAILATNTSTIPVTQIALGIPQPHRVIGVHFFNPAPLMKLVEIIPSTFTSIEIVNQVTSFIQSMGKTTISAKDEPGFIVNRVARPFYTESLQLMEEGISSVQETDEILTSCGFKMGPFRLMDLIGVDVNFSVTSSIYSLFHQVSRFRPSRTQQKLVDSGFWGRKSGRGFYEYEH